MDLYVASLSYAAKEDDVLIIVEDVETPAAKQETLGGVVGYERA